MATNKNLKISYGGLLPDVDTYTKDQDIENISGLRKYFQIFRNINVNPGTRSAYYLFKALSMLKKENTEAFNKLELEFWGNIYPGNVSLVKEEKLEDAVKILVFLPYEESLKKLKDSDVLFLPLETKSKAQEPLNIPSKLFEYLELEKPILSLVKDSDCKDILQKSGLAKIVEADSIDEIKDSFLQLIEEWEQGKLKGKYKADKEYIKNFSAESISLKFKKLALKVLDS